MEWYEITLIVLASLLVVLLIFIYVASLIMTKMIVHPKRYSRTEQTEYNEKMGFNEGVEVLKRTPIVFTMRDGYEINGDYNLIKGSNKFCILLHGHGTSREGALRYSLLFYELGFSTIIYDERSHGDNVHKDVTMGFVEAKDLSEIISQVYNKFGHDIELGLQGVSMGASTVLLSTQYTQDVKFIVSDCAFATLEDAVDLILKHLHLSKKIFIPLVNMNLKAFYHFSFKDSNPLSIIDKNTVPILYIHGNKDNFIDVKSIQKLYDKTKAFKKMLIVDGAGHASSITVNRELYKKTVKEFIDEVEKQNGKD